jgi:hypothetical protein
LGLSKTGKSKPQSALKDFSLDIARRVKLASARMRNAYKYKIAHRRAASAYQLRHIMAGLCHKCKLPVVQGSAWLCAIHAERDRVRLLKTELKKTGPRTTTKTIGRFRKLVEIFAEVAG